VSAGIVTLIFIRGNIIKLAIWRKLMLLKRIIDFRFEIVKKCWNFTREERSSKFPQSKTLPNITFVETPL